jgi:predicted RNA-binding Zn-ribbon protein involved in translation (DUF1610 family)
MCFRPPSVQKKKDPCPECGTLKDPMAVCPNCGFVPEVECPKCKTMNPVTSDQCSNCGFNAQCVETTLIPYTTGQFNISLGCYGCRASSDISDDLMFMGVPRQQMPELIKGLKALGRKAIPDSRNKVYLPPNI